MKILDLIRHSNNIVAQIMMFLLDLSHRFLPFLIESLRLCVITFFGKCFVLIYVLFATLLYFGKPF